MRLLLIILTIYTTSYGSYHSNYGNYHYGYNNVSIEQTPRIGYTTNYGRGMNSSVNNQYIYTVSPSMFNHSSTTTYNPGAAIGANRPRRVTVYNGSGETDNTPGGNNDSSDWLYMQDADGNWYCSKDGGVTWYRWEEKNYGWNILAYLADLISGNTEAWSTTPTTPPENSSHWASDPNDPFLEPIGDFPIGLAIGLFFIYWLYILIKKKPFDKDERVKVQSRRSRTYSS